MPKTISLKSGETVKLFTRQLSSVPIHYRFQAQAVGTHSLKGTVNVVGRQLVFRKPDVTIPLKEVNVVEAGYWDTFLAVYVTAETDLEIIYKQTGLQFAGWIIALVAVIVIVAIAITLFAG